MDSPSLIPLVLAVFAMAALYSAVGHGGASGYLAAMALLGVAPAVMKPTALMLNVLVAGIAAVRFGRAGCFSWRLFWPFALTSIPCSFLGGAVTLPTTLYKPVVGAVLLASAVRLVWESVGAAAETRRVPLAAALLAGALIGLLSGLTGVGGGIFLSPLLLLARWAEPRTTAGVSAVFILVNSLAGLAGHATTVAALPPLVPWLLAAAGAGALLGTTLGSRHLAPQNLRRLLAVVLLVAGLKMMGT